MGKSGKTSLLASFATIKSLSDERKYHSPYQILGEFIRFIITSEHIYAFSAAEMKNHLRLQFGFEIPEAVVKTAARKMAGVSLDNSLFSVAISEIGMDSLFEEKKREADDTNSYIITALAEYIKKRTGESAVWVDTLTQELIGFLVDDQLDTTGKYLDYIGEFILKNEHDSRIQEGLDRIREGSILYIGLNHNIGETGSITKPLTLFLGTEILFSLFGYNGEIYKQLAEDFYNLVRVANANGQKKIVLYYFQETKREIDDFFLTAVDIVEGKRPQLVDKPAMIAITNGCVTASDVAVKKADFYYFLKFSCGITEDPCPDYYDESLFESNLESFDYLDDEDKKSKREIGIKFVSHINKLRRGQRFSNDIDSEALLVTNAKATLLISKEQTERIQVEEQLDFVANFAVTLDRITSLLWYKLGNGFGEKEYPASISSLLKARVVLSASIAKNADIAFFDTKRKYEAGTITEDQLAARIIMLRNKPKLPEELQGDDIDTVMDFSPDFLSRYEEQVKTDRKTLREQEELIEALNAQSKATISDKDATIANQADIIAEKDAALSVKDDTIAAQQSALDSKDSENSQLRARLDVYERIEKEKAKKKARRTSLLNFIWCIIKKILIVAIIAVIVTLVCRRLSPATANTVGIVVGILGLISTGITVFQKDYKAYLSKRDK